MKRLSIVSLLLALTGCGLFGHPDDDPDGPGANVVRFTLDGQPVEILEELAYAVHDQSRDLLGPNTETYLEAGSPSTDPTRILGPKLQVNLPEGTRPGVYRLAYALFPSDRGPWVRFRESDTRSWVAYDGELTVQEVGGVGGRMRLGFEALSLSSDCGEERSLSAGTIDVAVGAETVFPDQEIEALTIPPAEAAVIGNSVAMSLSGRRWLCTAHTVVLQTFPGSQTTSGLPAEAMSVEAFCECGTAPDEVRWLGFNVPPGREGLVTVQESPYRLFLGIDEGTPFQLGDDRIYVPTQPTDLIYSGPVEALGTDLEFETTVGLLLSEMDPATGTIDPASNVVVGDLRFSGRVEEDCRPNLCP